MTSLWRHRAPAINSRRCRTGSENNSSNQHFIHVQLVKPTLQATASHAVQCFFCCLLGSHTVSVRAFCFSRRVCRLSVPRQISKLSGIGAKFRRLNRKSGSPSKNMTSDIAPEVAKYLKSSPKPQIVQTSVRAYCLAPLAIQLVLSCFALSAGTCILPHFWIFWSPILTFARVKDNYIYACFPYFSQSTFFYLRKPALSIHFAWCGFLHPIKRYYFLKMPPKRNDWQSHLANFRFWSNW